VVERKKSSKNKKTLIHLRQSRGLLYGLRHEVHNGVRDGVRSPEILRIWSAWVNLQRSICRRESSAWPTKLM
jgi:hypothetical protein